MAHKIIGVDLGTSTIKVARFDARFRKATLLDTRVVPSPAATGATAAERIAAQLEALNHALLADKIIAEELLLALPGELLTFRVVDLPFSDERRIESVLGYELESQVLAPVEELVIDHVVVGQRGSDTRVLVAAAPRAVVQAVVAKAAEERLALRILGAAPLAYAPLLAEASKSTPGAAMVIDVGHDTTTACVLRDGVPEFARTIARAGRHFTEAVAAGFRLDVEAAERAKRDAGFIGHAGMMAQSPSQARMDACLKEAARPLVRELRQTLAAYRAAYSVAVERIWVTGGGSRLVGLMEHLGEELSLPVSALPWQEAGDAGEEGNIRPEEDADLLGVAVGMAQVGLGALPRVNFRKGDLAYRSDYSFLRGKALHVGAAALLIVLFAVINAAAALRGLRKEHEDLTERLKRETTALFGEPRLDARAISDELKGGAKGGGGPPIPTVTAFDLFDEISRRVPPSDKLKLDVAELDIKPKKTFIKATAESAQQVDDLADALSKIECFEEVSKGKLQKVKGPPQPVDPTSKDKPAEPSEIIQFALTITTTCP